MNRSQPKKPLKIALVITQGELGGAQRYVFDLATSLLKDRYNVRVFIGREKQALGQKLEAAGIEVGVVKNLIRNINPLYDILAFYELKKILRDFAPDIVHLNSSKAGAIGSVAAHAAGIKNIVFTAHGFAFLEPHWFRFLYFWVEKIACIFRKTIITVSETDRLAAIKAKLCESEKLITIHNGITPPSSPPSIGGKREGVVIGTIAHDYPTKDLNSLRRAFALIKKEYPEAELKILSGVPDAARQLSEFSIYVCSSIKEGFPYTILEAMAAGLPIVSTAVGGIPEAITDKHEGLLVPPKNPKALATAIKNLLDNPELAKTLGQNAHERVKQFSLDQMVRKTMVVYNFLKKND